jgi:hypothetical protein
MAGRLHHAEQTTTEVCMRKSTLFAAVAALVFTAASSFAHHPFSQDFDKDKAVTLNGTVTKVQWTSPHVYTWMDVTDDSSGKVVNWKVEMGSPAALTKNGWTRTMLKTGQMVTLQGWRAKNGTNYANAEEMTMPDGKKLSAASSLHGTGAVATSGRKTPAPATSGTKTPAPAPTTSEKKY